MKKKNFIDMTVYASQRHSLADELDTGQHGLTPGGKL